MNQRRYFALALLLVTTLVACGGGGFGADGGVSGTGLSSVTGNVTAVTGMNGDIGGIRVRVQGTDIETVTDDDGSFALTGDFDGPVVVEFELDGGGRAETPIDVPTGGNVNLEDVTVDTEDETARPRRETIMFSGLVEEIDCVANTLRVVVGNDGPSTRFTVTLEGAFVHDGAGAPVACADIRRRDETTVHGEVLEDDRIGNADVEIRRRVPTATATPIHRPTAKRTPRDPGPERTLTAPTATPRTSDRPHPSATRPGDDEPRPTPTTTAVDAPRPAPVGTPAPDTRPALRP